MSCNHCAKASEKAASKAGAPEVEATWAENRAHPQFCPECHGFLRKDGGCTKCENATEELHRLQSGWRPSMAGVGPVPVPTLAAAMAAPAASAGNAPKTLSCGHNLGSPAEIGEEVWCTECDDWATVETPKPKPVSPPPSPADATKPHTEYGQAAYDAQHNKAKRPTAQAKVKAIGYRINAALRGSGVPAGTSGQKIHNMVWQYLDRCTCGAWISPRSGVCRNPRCGQKNTVVGVTRPWPPGDVSWVQRKQDVGFEVGHPAVPHPVPPSPAKPKNRQKPAPAKAVLPSAGKAAAINITAAEGVAFVEDVDAELKRRNMPELSDEEAATWIDEIKARVAAGTPVDRDAVVKELEKGRYRGKVDSLAGAYALTADDFLDGVDLDDQIASGETPDELVARLSEKHDLTSLSDIGGSDEPIVASGDYSVILDNPTVGEVEQAWRAIEAELDSDKKSADKYALTFSEPVELQRNRRRTITSDRMEVHLFAGGGAMAYSFYKNGRILPSDVAAKITGISPVLRLDPAAEQALHRHEVTRLGVICHPNAWVEEREEMKNDPGKFKDRGTNRVSMKKVFGEKVVKQLEAAFEQCEDFRYSLPGKQRDRSVSVTRQPDGSVRAWYSSEYAGNLNGDYYLLLNPHTASFKETD